MGLQSRETFSPVSSFFTLPPSNPRIFDLDDLLSEEDTPALNKAQDLQSLWTDGTDRHRAEDKKPTPKTYKRVRKDKCMPDIDERRVSAEVWNTKQDGAAPPLALQENDCVPGIFRTHTETDKTLTVREDAPIRQSADCMPGAFRRYRYIPIENEAAPAQFL